jgi:hypothetical protein
MPCFWAGEACLGEIDGVIGTRTGMLEGKEAVEVAIDPSRLSYEALLQKAHARGCMSHVFARTPEQRAIADRAVGHGRVSSSQELLRPAKSDDKHSLAATPWRFVPMTGAQATRANARLARNEDPSSLFSARQLAIYRSAARAPDAGWSPAIDTADLRESFARAERLAQSGR